MNIQFNTSHPQIRLALSLCIEAHAGQYRRDFTTPYLNHPISVANRVFRRYGGTDYKRIATALLHDTIEDSDGKITEQYLLDKGVEVDIVAAVVILTKTKDTEYSAYLQKIIKNEIARDAKIEDMIDNLADSPSFKQITKYAIGLQTLANRDIQRGKHVEKL